MKQQVNWLAKQILATELQALQAENDGLREAVEQLLKRVEALEDERDGLKLKVGTLTAKASEDEIAILRAWNELQEQEKPVTRTGIMQHLGWTKKRWETIKTVCDKYKIAC